MWQRVCWAWRTSAVGYAASLPPGLLAWQHIGERGCGCPSGSTGISNLQKTGSKYAAYIINKGPNPCVQYGLTFCVMMTNC